MLICNNCKEAYWSHGEHIKTTEIDCSLEELDVPIYWGHYDDDGNFIEDEHEDIEPYVECDFCNEVYLISEVKEVI